MMPRLLGLPSDNSYVAGVPVDLPARRPSPIAKRINYRPVNLLQLPTPNSRAGRQQVDSRIDRR